MKVLVPDDELGLRNFISAALEDEGRRKTPTS
jgi:DNA-binding response OmpR family regulator